jgi:RimJ/RimL family protein N-acetyltransferase
MADELDVHLRDATASDEEIFYKHQLDPEATVMAAFTARDRQSHRAHWARILADDSVVTKAIIVDGEVAGNIVSWVQDGHLELGYWIGRTYWGRGVATKAVAQFVQLVTERPLFAWVADVNAGSVRVLEKCGFTLAEQQPERSPEGVKYLVFELRA